MAINARKEKSELAVISGSRTLPLLSEVFGSGEVHVGSFQAYFVNLKGYFPKATIDHFHSFPSYFITSALSSFSANTAKARKERTYSQSETTPKTFISFQSPRHPQSCNPNSAPQLHCQKNN